MKTFLIPFILIVCLFMTACINEDEPKDKVEEIRIDISAETGVTYVWSDGNKEHPIECMLVKLPNDPDTWQPMMFGEIEGFTYERGHEYYLSVIRTTLANPPADTYCYTYSLIKILSDRLVEEPEVPVDKDVTSIDDIEYQERCPFKKYAIESLYNVNGDGILSYSDGCQAPSYKNVRIYIEDVLPMDDPNWTTFQHIPYQATYSYVFSPLTTKVRLVRNESSGPMFKNVVPEDEFNDIVKNLKANEELKYTIVLANVYKLGLQKLNFTIRKN
ncbi:MAG: DUF4377 domain-containing protein [Bacteroides sp.]|nr:DUF4377 domain-containing protein [Bacteroides sp.]